MSPDTFDAIMELLYHCLDVHNDRKDTYIPSDFHELDRNDWHNMISYAESTTAITAAEATELNAFVEAYIDEEYV